MPYKTTSDIPQPVQDALPAKAQDMWMKVYNSASKQYDGDKSRSAATAWAAVKRKYKKGENGDWALKEGLIEAVDRLLGVTSALLLLLLLSGCASAPEQTECPGVPPEAAYSFELVRVVDGDTIEVLVDIGFNTYRKVSARLDGVDTPEIYGVKKWMDDAKTAYTEEYARGAAASEFTKSWLRSECPCTIEVDGAGKYGRWIIVVYSANGASLNDALVESGNAVIAEY